MQYKALITNLYSDFNYGLFWIKIFVSTIVLKNYKHKILPLSLLYPAMANRKNTITKNICPKKMIYTAWVDITR